MQCAAAANDPRSSGAERDRLLVMRKALLELADAQDWLDGKRDAAISAYQTSSDDLQATR